MLDIGYIDEMKPPPHVQVLTIFASTRNILWNLLQNVENVFWFPREFVALLILKEPIVSTIRNYTPGVAIQKDESEFAIAYTVMMSQPDL